MIDLMKMGLAAQQEIVNANKRATLTDKEAKEIKAQGKKIVHRPDELKILKEQREELRNNGQFGV